MTFAEMLKSGRDAAGVSCEELAGRLSFPVEIVAYLEEPTSDAGKLVDLFASALGMTPETFRGETAPEPSEEEKVAAVAANAKYPNVRRFILDPARCADPRKALEMFGGEEFPLMERNIVLYLSTTALYSFCDTNSSSFGLDEYLFKLHGALFAAFEQELGQVDLPADEREERLDNARSNVFACDAIENIAIRILEPLAAELDQKLADGVGGYEDDLGMPFTWQIDDALMKLRFMDGNGRVIDEINLLDVRERRQPAA